jgi:ATP-dependent RNA helicase HelY
MSIAAAAPGPPGSNDRSEALAEFASAYDFPLDGFQVRACEALERGDGVLVAAPTGAGKTIVGEFAVHLALRLGQKCFYTTPIKALSNQKFADLSARYGASNVGLLTGDNSINGDAPVVVMTTEVLRNMIYAGSSALRGLGYVVMDEVHYLSDRFRGAVWEEVIIHLPEHVRLVSLSATVSNTEEFADWLVTVRGHTQVVVEEHRPVPLWQHVLSGTGCRTCSSTAAGTTSRGTPTTSRSPACGSIPSSTGWPATRDASPVRDPVVPGVHRSGHRGAAAACPAGSTSSTRWTVTACCR